jgi:erythronate-4-phosphate dehydrogenase
MKIVADENILPVKKKFAREIDWVDKPGREICAEDVRDADALLVRSVTRVDEALLAGSAVKFVGTATSGTDHLDMAWLKAQGITVVDAAGSNANAVAEYVLAVLAQLILDDDIPLWDMTIAVVGVGHVGSTLVRKLRGLGLHCIGCDPLQQTISDLTYVDLQQALQADVICLHTPLIMEGKNATWHMIGAEQLSQLKEGAVLINAGRGDVVDNTALLSHLQKHPQQRVALDVWANEPRPSAELMKHVYIATPHIAGYSVEAKVDASMIVTRELARHFALDELRLCVGAGGPLRVHDQQFEGEPGSRLRHEKNEARMFAGIVTRALDLRALSQRFEDIYQVASRSDNPMDGAEVFDRIRKEMLLRREFGATHIHAAGFSPQLAVRLHAAGFVLQA